MRKFTLLSVALLTTLSLFAETKIEKLWEKSETTASKPDQIGVIDYRDFGYYNDTIYLQDKVNSKLYLFNNEGVYLRTKNSAAYHAIDFDDAGNLVSANFPVSNLDLKLYNPVTETFSDLGIATTGARADFPTVYGNIQVGEGAVYCAPSGMTKFFRANFTDGVLTSTDEFPLSTSSAGQNYIIPVSKDTVIVCLRSSKIFYYDLKQKKEGDVLLSGAANTASLGGTYFEYDEDRYLVQACANSANGNYMGAFKIYNINDPKQPWVVYAREEDLGKTVNSNSTAVHFEATIKPQGVFIYQFVPKNGLAAYKLYTPAETMVTLPTEIDFALFDELGSSETSGSSMPKLVPIIPDAFGYEKSKTDTVFLTYKYGIDTCSYVYSAGGKIKLSSSSVAGSFRTLPVNTDGVQRIQVSFRAVAWAQTKTQKDAQLKLTYGDQVKTIDIPHKEEIGFPVNDEHLLPYEITFDAIEQQTPITFEALKTSGYDPRLFMDDLVFEEYVSSKLDAPDILPGGVDQMEPIEVTITAAEGATIRYTLDDTDPSETTGTIYTDPFTISTSTIVKAIAYAAGSETSNIARQEYKFPTPVATIADLRAQNADNSTVYKLTGEAVITLKSGSRNTKYIQDATGAVLIDDQPGALGTIYNLGDAIQNVYGKLTLYNKMLQFVPTEDPGAPSSTGNVITPKEVTLEELGNYPAQLVKVKNVTINGTGDFTKSTNYNLNGASNPVLRTHYEDMDYINTPIPTTAQDIVGVVMIYNSTVQLIPRSLAEITESATVGFEQTAEGFIYSTNGKLIVAAIPGEKIEVYNSTGRKLHDTVASGETIFEGFTAGEIVIVKTAKKAVKIVIR